MRHILFIFTTIFIASGSVFAQGPPTVAQKDLNYYLFAYFTGNNINDESIHFAISTDGYNYFALNNNQPVISSKAISSTGGVRDPHILRCNNGKTFYMVATDMVSANGWDSNRAMVLLKSDDLVNWSSSVINIQNTYAGHQQLKRVWAPQTIYDNQAGKYMVYFSMQHGNGPDIIYYAYANSSFTAFDSEPKQLFFPANGKSCIDGDIIYKDSLYHLFYKTEGHGNGIKQAVTKSLTSGVWNELPGYMQQTTEAVEGSAIFKLSNTDTYILMYDVYIKGSYQFTSSTSLDSFKIIDNNVSMDFHPRHGSVIAITRPELKNITNKWGLPHNFGSISNNPVLTGYYADPDIMYSQKTGKYYIYPTTDGYDSWNGNFFKAFSSDNLTDWHCEGTILTLGTDVKWANRNAWAPCIIEKQIKNNYKYYYYFSAAQKIGVAVANNPTGPFTDAGSPIVNFTPAGANGQQIDPEVFTDPLTDISYLYWGNGYLAVAQLEKNMLSINKKTTKIITPDNTFREGVTVFYRDKKYYFLWSEDDTRSPNYRVRYGTSNSPTGPIIVNNQNIVIEKDTTTGIFGTGHNSVLQIKDTNQWYIVYHRFNYPNGIKMGHAAGFNREVCIDKLIFAPNGDIIKVKPTHKGIEPIVK